MLFLTFTGQMSGQKPTIEVQPSSIDVSPWYSTVKARVILKNGGMRTLARSSLSAVTNDALRVVIGKQDTPALPAGGVSVWPVEIREVDKARLPGSVLFDALYTTDDGTREHAYASLAIKLTDAGQQKPVEISVHGTFDSIAANRPGLGCLLATNNLDVPVNITRIDVTLPPSLHLPANKTPGPFIVPPRSATRQGIELDAAASVTPGKYSVPFELRAEWDALGHHESRTLVVNQDATVGVFFESEILKALGVPSFLLLPGCLFIFTMQLLLAFGLFGLVRT
ncbi:MAG: hypothetical protein EXQ47_08875 [Bryobacterales bacterium]|nr:hypothetical protein [Bryobacterales bacterium]